MEDLGWIQFVKEKNMSKNYFMGIDVSKGYADFSLLNEQKRIVERCFQLYDIEESYSNLDSYYAYISSKYKPKQIYVALESTGSYENHWLDKIYHMSSKYPLKVAHLNPLGVAKYRQSESKGEQVTDKSSCIAIARYLVNHYNDVVYYQPDKLADCRVYLRHIELLKKQKVQLSNKLQQYLYLYFPEILPHCRYSLGKMILALIAKYPTSNHVARTKESTGGKMPYMAISKWKQLRERCKLTSRQETSPIVAKIISDTAKKIQVLGQDIDEMYDLLSGELPQKELSILTSIPGVGERSATIILSIIGDISRFNTPQQVVGYFGLYPVIKESGDLRRRPYLSKRGNALMRKTLYMCTLVACYHDKHFKQLYSDMVDKGIAKKDALCRLMKKMLRIIYGMLKSKTYYDSSIDESNRQKRANELNKNGNVTLKNENLSDRKVAMAPISRKNAKSRKEQAMPTHELEVQYGHYSPSQKPIGNVGKKGDSCQQKH
jgi:transposase